MNLDELLTSFESPTVIRPIQVHPRELPIAEAVPICCICLLTIFWPSA